MSLTELAPCIPPLGIPAGWFFAAMCALVFLTAWGLALAVKGHLNGHYRQQPLPPRVVRPEPWHGHVFRVTGESRGEGVAKCGCGALAAVFVEAAA